MGNVLETPEIIWSALGPVVFVLLAGVIGMLVEAFVPAAHRRSAQVFLGGFALLAAAVALQYRISVFNPEHPLGLVHGELVEDGLSLASQGILILVGFLALLVMAGSTDPVYGSFAGQPADRPGSDAEKLTIQKKYQRTEIYPLAMFSLGGMMLFPAAQSLLTLFVALEIMSLPLYVLAASSRRHRLLSQEAGLKYFILGAFSSGFFLMGAAFLYGYSGSILLSRISRAVPLVAGMDWLLLAGVVLVTVGLLFKVGAAPFHAWTPDVYQGAPTPVTGFMAAGVKIAAFGALIRFWYLVGGHLNWDLAAVMWGITILTMVVGTVLGILQQNIKRMLAYSSIAHAGFILIGLLSLQGYALAAILFYLLTYGIATVGVFGIVTLVRVKDETGNILGEAHDIKRWAGLGKTQPVLAVAMLIFMLSFAGIPLTAGFVGKFMVFSSGVAGGLLPLVIVAVAASAATAFFYMRLILLMFFTEPSEGVAVTDPQGITAVTVGICAFLTLLLGIIPGPVLSLLADVNIVLM